MIYRVSGPQRFAAVKWDFKLNFFTPSSMNGPCTMKASRIRYCMDNLRRMIREAGGGSPFSERAHARMIYAINLEVYEAVLERRRYIVGRR